MRRGILLLVGCVTLLSGVLLVSNLWWLDNNELPDGFQNEYEHFYTLTEVYFRARDNSVAEAWGPLWDGYYPPLPHLVASAGMSVFGRSRVMPAMMLGTFVVLLLAMTCVVAAKLKDTQTALVATGLVAFYPAIFGNAHRYEPNVALAAMVAAAAGLLVVRRGLPDARTAAGFGVLCGLGMLTDRLVFAVYLAPVVAVALWRLARGPQADRRAGLLRWLAAGASGALVCGYYYWRFLSGHLDEVLTQLGGEITAGGSVGQALPVWTTRGLLYYPLSFLDTQMGLLVGLATLVGLGLWVRRGRQGVDPAHRALLEGWLLGGLLIVTLVSKKQPFYSIPLLAPAAVAAAIGWRTIEPKKLRAALAIAAMLAGLHQLIYLTRDETGLLPAPGRWAWFAGRSPFPPMWLGYEYTQAAPPMNTGLNLERIADLCDHQRRKAPDKPYTMVFSDAHGAYEGQLNPTLRLELDTLLVEGVLMNGPAVQDQAELASCFVHVTSGDSAWPTADAVRDEWAEWGVGEPTPALLAALRSMSDRSYPLDRWTTDRGDHVHVFTLVATDSP